MSWASRVRPKRRRGIAIVLSMFFLMLLFLIALGLIAIVPQELRSATKNNIDTQAHYAATAGTKHAKAWLQAVVNPGTSPADVALGDDWAGAGGWTGYGGTTTYPNEPMCVPPSNTDFELLDLSAVSFPKAGYPLVGRALAGAKGLGLDGAADVINNPKVIASERPLVIGDWQVWTAIVPDRFTFGSNYFSSTDINYPSSPNTSLNVRSYTVVSIAFNQGVPKVRSRTVFKEDNFAKFALFIDKWPSPSVPGETPAGKELVLSVSDPTKGVVDGPAHTNSFWRLNVAASYWNTPLTGLNTHGFKGGALTSADTPPTTTVAASLNADDVAWSSGNWNANDINRRPFDNSKNTITGSSGIDRYSRLIEGGRGNLRPTGKIALPPDSKTIAQSAFGQNTGLTMGSPDATQTAVGADGFFINKNSGGQVAGGVYVKAVSATISSTAGIPYQVSNVAARNLVLEAVDGQGVPVLNVAELATGSGQAADANPGMRLLSDQTRVVNTGTVVTNTLQPTVSATATVPNSTKTVNQTLRQTQNTATVPKTMFQTQGTATLSQTTTKTQFQTLKQTTSVWDSGGSGGSGAGWVFSTLSTATVPTKTANSTNPTATLKQTVPTATVSSTLRQTVATATIPTATVVSSATLKGTATATIPVTQTMLTTFNPQDRVIETKNKDLVIAPTQTWAGAGWNFAAGQQDTGSDKPAWFRYNKMPNATFTDIFVNGARITSPMTVPVGYAVLMKQNRDNPKRLDVWYYPKPSGSNQILNGQVYSEGSLHSLKGVNLGRRTIAADQTSQIITISDNVFQYKTALGAKPADAKNGLGLIADYINVNAEETKFNAIPGQSLYIYAVMMAGHDSGSGGFGLQKRFLSSQFSNGVNPWIRLVGGVIERTGKIRYLEAGSTKEGWNQQFVYDPQLALSPPPGFPSNNRFIPVSYTEQRL